MRGFLRFSARNFSTPTSKKTPLYAAHLEMNAKMVDFAGYSLPVQYEDSVINSHNHCRQSASLFDVSHMGQVIIRGKNRAKFLESLVVGDLEALKPNQSRLSLLTNEKGGIIDDCMITKKDKILYMVVNGACKEKDLAHMRSKLSEFNSSTKSDVTIEHVENRALLALQGPKAAEVLNGLLPDSFNLPEVNFMYSFHSAIGSVKDCWIARCGYTGEDGFEISVPSEHAIPLLNLILSDKRVLPAGLAVRDSLRLEAGLCLYGHDINDTTTPNEAGLLWTITKRRREEGGFPGHKVIMDQLKSGVQRKRVGLEVLDGAPAREHSEVVSKDGAKVGEVTSGGFSPTLKKKISMAYVATESSKPGTELGVKVRGKTGAAKVVPLPFNPTNYYKGNTTPATPTQKLKV